ncbi:MAG TPA: UDP-N-acetylmuramoyl-L-alanine--D-glutamate ligase [Candidatus Limnocylindrales bacterium]
MSGPGGINATAPRVEPIALDRLSLDSFAGQPVAVLGLARSGVALARFLADRGARVTVYDAQPTAALTERLAELGDRPVRALLGPEVEPAAALAGQALICTSPSVNSRYPTTEPRLRAALAAIEAAGQVPVISEIDLFLRLCPSMTIGVTGTKGKTTTSSLIAALLARGPLPVLLGGNIGTPLVERLPELSVRHRVVLELSELQLPTLSRGTDVGVYTHVTSDHLDRHGSVEAYRAAKRRLAELVPVEGRLVLNADDPVSRAFASAGQAWPVYYSRDQVPHGGVGVREGWIVADDVERLAGGRAMTGPEGRVLPLDDIALPGAHNVSNVLAAVAVGLLFGIAPDAMRAVVSEFSGVEHRLETVAVLDGVRFVNDSMGTQPDAVIAALRAFAPPIVLIAGGRSKDLSLDALAAVVAQRAAAVVLIGESAAEMERLFRAAGAPRIERATDMAAAVAMADDAARELQRETGAPATVLLSPAAASFDMFVDYADRGRAFRAAVQALGGGGDR